MIPGFKPLLSGKAPSDLTTLRYPLIASPKLDGIRVIVDKNGDAWTRNMKPVPNVFVRETLKQIGCRDLDGEIIVGSPVGNDVINRTTSGVMKRDGVPLFTYHVFDCIRNPELSFTYRLKDAKKYAPYSEYINLVDQRHLSSGTQLQDYAERMVKKGYEGAMVRNPDGPYKFGRSTTKEGILLKIKFFEDAEATVVDVVELMHNENEQTRDELGRAKRSKKKSGMVGTDTLGALVCELPNGTRFEIGTGFTQAQREDIWFRRGQIRDSQPMVTFKHQDFTPEGVPRFPVLREFRFDL